MIVAGPADPVSMWKCNRFLQYYGLSHTDAVSTSGRCCFDISGTILQFMIQHTLMPRRILVEKLRRSAAGASS